MNTLSYCTVFLITVVESFVAQTTSLDSYRIGAMTISIMAFRIMTFSIIALDLKVFLQHSA
jgi:hypothetical protein